MKVDTSKLKKGSSELTPECRQLIEQITKCKNRTEILKFLETIQVWVYGKCELYHWIEILDRFDKVLEEAAHHVNGNEFVLHCDTTFSPEDIRLLLLVLNFTTLLIEHSFSRHLYNSIEHLTQLLSSQNMDIVLAVLNLLYMFSKRSNFIPRLSFERKEMLLIKLFNIAERWGDPNYGLALIDCCMRKPKFEFLYQLFIEYLDESGQGAVLEIPDMMDICANSSPSEVVNAICKQMSQPSDAVKMRIAHRVRLVSGFKDHKMRLQFVQARLQAVSVLIYSNALQENIERVLYPGFGEELCELIEKEDVQLVEIRAAVLRTLTSMLHFDRNPNVPRPGSRLTKIIHYTGADRQGGILPLLVRDCIASLIGEGPSEKYPLILATSLFSLLYHLASYEAGGNALVKSGMMQSLLQVISWPGVDLEHITFVTRAVRVIDLITNIDIAKFHLNNGLNIFIDRLEKEIASCRKAVAESDSSGGRDGLAGEGNVDGGGAFYQHDQGPHEGPDHIDEVGVNDEVLSEGSENHNIRNESPDGDTRFLEGGGDRNVVNMAAYGAEAAASAAEAAAAAAGSSNSLNQNPRYPSNSYYARPLQERTAHYNNLDSQQQKKVACVTQRAALLKSMLNFLKKSIQDHAHFNGMRNIMETSLPLSLRHIISNAEYYGPSLFLLATDVFTVYVFNEPSLLSSLQDSGITSVMLQSLLQKDVPATREVLGSLPNVFSAMCLNERGLMEFMSYDPFDKLLKVLLSPDYLVAMRRRRSSDPLGDTATNLGNAMDDLMKHHPYLRTDATEAIVRLLHELVRLGSDPNFICWRANKDNNAAAAAAMGNGAANSGVAGNGGGAAGVGVGSASAVDTASNENENDSSGDDEDEDDEMSSASQQQRQQRSGTSDRQAIQARIYMQEREAIPLIDYILNVMKFIEAIFSNSSNGDHCREFVLLGGLKPLLQLLSLPNLPVDSPVSTTAQAVANVCKSILNLAHETKVIDTALQQLWQIVDKLQPMIDNFNFASGSILLCELLNCPKIEDGFSIADYTPLLHSMSSVHGYVVMLVNLCRNASNDMRTILLKRWGTNGETGLQLLNNLVNLYISLVWESTILLSLCSDEPYAQNANGTPADTPSTLTTMNVDAKAELDPEIARKIERAAQVKEKLRPEEQLRYIKALLAASSRLGRALAELFGTLVKLSVGTPQSRQRRNNEFVAAVPSRYPTSDAKEIARVLSSILVNGFNHENILPNPVPKLKLTFLICSVGFTGPMLFDDKRNSFHLMISQFCDENGLNAFFDMFFWALALDGGSTAVRKFCYDYCMNAEDILEDCEDDAKDYPEGTGEFLDAWLQLLEKMINPRAILESPYAIAQRTQTTPDGINFEPIFYLVQMHKLALQTIRRIWKRKPIANYGVSMTETMITILKHLIKSYNNLSDRHRARLGEIKNAKKVYEHNKRLFSASEEAILSANARQLEVLTDMGFARGPVIEALKNTHSLEQATEFLLNQEANIWLSPQPRTSASANDVTSGTSQAAASAAAGAFNNDMDVDVVMADQQTASEAPSVSNSNSNISAKMDFLENQPIPEKVFAKFCDETLHQIFCLMEFLPETVNNGAELVYVLYRRHSHNDKYLFIWNLVKSGTACIEDVLEQLKQRDIVRSNKLDEFMASAAVRQLMIRLKVSTLLLDETYPHIRREFCVAISQDPHLGTLIQLLNTTERIVKEHLSLGGKPITPKWLQNLIELIDAIDNVSLISQRKANMRAVASDTWRWYDASSGKWNAYSEANNSILMSCFSSGDRSVGINIGRQRYTINFNCMTQVSEASGSHRPVMPSLRLVEAISQLVTGNPNAKYDSVLTRIVKGKDDKDEDIHEDRVLCLPTLLNYYFDEEKAGNEEGAPPPAHAGSGEENKEAAPMATQTDGQPASVDTPSLPPATPATPVVTTPQTQTPVAPQADDLSKSSPSGKRIKAGGKGTPAGKGKKSSEPATPEAEAAGKQLKIVLYEDACGLAAFDTAGIISCLVSLLQTPLEINFETKLSILKLCARLTKSFANARVFAKCGGISLLLKMRQSCGLMGFPTYAIILIRHVLEAPAVLQESIERVLLGRTTHLVPVGQRDLNYILTQISSAVARHPEVFLAAAKQVFRADVTTNGTYVMDDSRFIVRAPATKKCSSAPPKMDEDVQTSVDVIKDLLLAIVQPCVHYGGVAAGMEKSRSFDAATPTAGKDGASVMPDAGAVPQKTSATAAAAGVGAAQANAKKLTEQIEPSCCSWHIPSSGHMHEKPILPRSTLIKILADAVRSYQSLVPKIIVEHVYTPADSPLIEKEQSVLSFVLDHFLPIVRRQQDPEVSMMTRVLIASLSDCSANPMLQSKVVEELHEAMVRALSLPESTEKHTRLQVLIGLLPVMIENPLASTKGSLTRNNMYKVLLRQGIMTDLTKIAQYKDLSDSNALATIYSILRPMEILLRLTVAPGALSARRIILGRMPQGSSTTVNRRFYPRLATRPAHSSPNGIDGEFVLRDIIRNVLSDRRHAFDFIFNPDDIFVDQDDPSANSDSRTDEDANDVGDDPITSTPLPESSLNFERLWDDLLQTENLLLVNRNGASANNDNLNAGPIGGELHRNHNHNGDNDAGNNDGGVGGGSDGASTSSETVANANNAQSLLGEVTSSESDSDSNVSTENDDRNEEDEDDDEEEGGEEGVDERSETDADEETRQYIEVFDHIYEPESSETASNDADVDADDEASEVGAASSVIDVPNAMGGAESNSADDHMQADHEQGQGRGANSVGDEENSEQAHNVGLQMVHSIAMPARSSAADDNASSNSLRTTPASAWVTPRVSFSDVTYTTTVDLSMGGNNAANPTAAEVAAAVAAHQHNDRNENATVVINVAANNPPQLNMNGQRREPTRRLVFLDQQYCSPMPSFNHPTEEGQIELFNQDSLHWWLEEAKHLDLESQTDACLCVAHFLVPFLLEELKVSYKQYAKKELATPTGGKPGTTTGAAGTTAGGPNRRSAIPILIPPNVHAPPGAPLPNSGSNPLGLQRDLRPGEFMSAEAGIPFRVPTPLRSVRDAAAAPPAAPPSAAASSSQGETGAATPGAGGGGGGGNAAAAPPADGDDTDISTVHYPLPAIADAIDDAVDEDDDDDDEEEDEDDYGDDDDQADADVDDDAPLDADGDVDDDAEEEDDDADSDGTGAQVLHGDGGESASGGAATDADFNPSFIDGDDEYGMPPLINASDALALLRSQEDPATTTAGRTNEAAPDTVMEQPPQAAAPQEMVQAADGGAVTPPESVTPPTGSTDSGASTVTASTDSEGPPATPTQQAEPAGEEGMPSEAASASASTDGEEAAGAAAPPMATANVTEMSPEVRAALGDLEVPEGVDPSFLAALPSEMREEVIQEHLRMQRNRQRIAQQNAIQTAHDSLLEVNPEFLAALPPNIQSEVLMQQRIEQQRQVAQSTNPEDPVDTAAFFQNLSESLRQAILTDMEESQIASLPPDLAAEAQYLRRDWENRHGPRIDPAPTNTLSGYLSTRFPSTFLNDEARWHTSSIWYDANGAPQNQHHHHTAIVHQNPSQVHGKPAALLVMEDENNLLDPDSISTLLLFLFIDDPKLNYTRLHRVIRNLCYHSPTRDWVIKALISIIHKTNEGKVHFGSERAVKPEWLKLRVDAAFGYKSNVFIISRPKEGGGDFSITINPQAAQMVVRNCLDMLFILAKHFPGSFVPYSRDGKGGAGGPATKETDSQKLMFSTAIDNIPMALTIASIPTRNATEISPEELRSMVHRHHPVVSNIMARRSPVAAGPVRLADSSRCPDHFKLDEAPSTSKAAASRAQQKPNASSAAARINKLPKGVQYNTNTPNFWDTLLQIDAHTAKRTAHMHAFPLVSHPVWEWETQSADFLAFNDSPFAKILEMLPYKVICRSPHLTDMLIKLLASLSTELPREEEPLPEPVDDPTAPKATAEAQRPPTTATATPAVASGEVATVAPATAAPSTTNTTTTTAVAATPETSTAGPPPPPKKEDLLSVPHPVKNKRKIYSKNFLQLQLVIEVLTHQCGTSDGLDNISKLIVNLSQCSQASNAIFIQYLTVAILGLAQEVRQAIQCLLDEIRAYNAANKANLERQQAQLSARPSTSAGVANASSSPLQQQGIMQDRFTAESVVISAPNIKPICELQLPAMKKLLSPSSAQPYFLRTLKIFMEVRELFELQESHGDMVAAENAANSKPTLSQIICLDDLWDTLSECLAALEESKDENAVLVLQSTVEAFFLIHASQKKTPKNARGAAQAAAQAPPAAAAAAEEPPLAPTGDAGDSATRPPQAQGGESPAQPAAAESKPDARESQLKCDRQKFLEFAEKHRTVLNQILRQSPTHLSDGPFAVLVDHTRILDFDVKRKYFQTELERIDEGVRREENTVTVRRVTVFEDSFRVLYRLGPEEWKNRFYIVFEDEEGQDAGGLLREWYVIISREIFNPMYALFCVSPGDRVTYMINPSSHANPNHLSYFKFVGRVIAKAVHDNKLLECYFTRSFYKHILGKQVKHTDMESQDYEFYKGLDYLMKNDISTLGYELTFSTEVQEFGVTQVRDLIPNGRDITVTEENKFEYVQLVCQLKMSGSIRQQLDAFLEGFYDIIPKHLISIFNEQELELLISGLPDIDIEDLKANTEYHKYTSKSIQIQWFWRALRSFDQADRAKFLQFVTGTSKVPLQGFGSLEGMNGIQKFQIHRDDRSTDRLPCAHTCFNQLDLPMYKSYEKLRTCLLKAIHECSEGFGFA